MKELLQEIKTKIDSTEDVSVLKELQAQHDKIEKSIARETELTTQIETLTGEHNVLIEDYRKAVRNSVVREDTPPKGDEPKDDKSIYDAWKEGLRK